MASRVQRSSERNVRTQVRRPVEALRCLRQHTEGGLGRPQSGEAIRSSSGSGDRHRGRTDIRGVRGRCTPGCQPGRRPASSTGSCDRRGYPSEKGGCGSIERETASVTCLVDRWVIETSKATSPRSGRVRLCNASAAVGPVARFPGEYGVKHSARTRDQVHEVRLRKYLGRRDIV